MAELETTSNQKSFQFSSVILKVTKLTPTVNEVICSAPEDFSFYAGQMASVFVKDKTSSLKKATYAMAAPPQGDDITEKTLTFLIKDRSASTSGIELFEMEQDDFFSYFKKGAVLEVIAPLGTYFVNDDTPINKNIVLIGTSIHIAQIKSILEYFFDNDFLRRITLLYQVEDDEEIIYTKLWYKHMDTYPNFHMRFTVLKKINKDFNGQVGPISQLFSEYLKDNLDSNYYCVGPPKFVKDVKSKLSDYEIDESNLFFSETELRIP